MEFLHLNFEPFNKFVLRFWKSLKKAPLHFVCTLLPFSRFFPPTVPYSNSFLVLFLFSILCSNMSHFEFFDSSQLFVCFFLAPSLNKQFSFFFLSAEFISFCSKACCPHSFVAVALENKCHPILQDKITRCHKHDRISLPTLSYKPASLCPKDRPSCADTITLLFSE